VNTRPPIALPALVAVLLFVLLFALTGASSATTLAREDFGYAYGELDGQSGGVGFAGAWTADTAATEVADPGTALSYAGGAELIHGGAEALLITGDNNNLAFRDLASAISADEIFVGFLFRYVGALDDNDFAALWHDNSGTGTHTSQPTIGIKANQEDGSGPEDVMARIEGGSEAYFMDLSPGQTYFILGRLFKSSPGAANDYDRFDLWVNPTAGDSGSPDATSSGGGNTSSFGTIGLRGVNIDGGDSFWIDEIRYASTFESATAPEPSSSLLVMSGLIAMALRRRSPRA
jgi:hypothetical protein